MATPRRAQQASQTAKVTYNREDPNHQVVDPRWLGKVLGVTIALAFLCSYLAMCALFALGSWQLVLHPTNKAGGGTGLPGAEVVKFGPDPGGVPQLVGEFVPQAVAQGAAAREYTTVLYLRDGDGQLGFADAPLVAMLHDLGMNVLAFDYRGYGRSGVKPHPRESR